MRHRAGYCRYVNDSGPFSASTKITSAARPAATQISAANRFADRQTTTSNTEIAANIHAKYSK